MQGKGCCCSSRDDLHSAMDTVSAQQLTQGMFLETLHKSSDANPEEEEEVKVSVKRNNAAMQHLGASDDKTLRKQLLIAVRQDDAPGVLQYVADGADLVDMGEALRLAAHRGSASVVRELVAVGLSVNDGCPHTGFTPLQLAAASGHLVVCELLLDALADVHRPIGGTTALSLARKMGNVEVEEVIERHVAALLLQDQGEGGDDGAQYRRAHVLPRVSPVLSEAVLQALPASSASQLALDDTREAQEAREAQPHLEEDSGGVGEDCAPDPCAEMSPRFQEAPDRVLPL